MSGPTNFYTSMEKKYIGPKNKQYGNFKQINIETPMRMIICGKSGSMKTNTLINIIRDIDAFDRIYLICKNLDQPLYKMLIDKMKALSTKVAYDVLTASENIDQTPDVDKLHAEFPNENILIIFDDIITESSKKLKLVSDVYVRGRSLNISVITISQSYFALPKILRSNADYLILKSVIGRDLSRILSEYALDVDKKELLEMYTYATKKPTDFFMIDMKTINPKLRFRINYSPLR